LLWIVFIAIKLAIDGVAFSLPYIVNSLTNSDAAFTFDAANNGASLVGDIISFFMIENKYFGRKNSLTVTFSIGAIGSFGCYLLGGKAFYVFLIITGFSISSSYIFAYSISIELYDTRIRSTGLGWAYGIGALAEVSLPFIVFSTIKHSVYLPFLIFGCIFVCGAIAAQLLPRDTTGSELDMLEDDKRRSTWEE